MDIYLPEEDMNKWLNHCQENQQKLFDRIEKYHKIIRDIK
jgi:hypothetical protein